MTFPNDIFEKKEPEAKTDAELTFQQAISNSFVSPKKIYIKKEPCTG